MKFLLVLIILYNILNSAHSAPTITAVSNGKFGVPTYITITGTGFTGTPVVTIGGQTCDPVIVANTASLQCQFSAQLAPGNSNFDVIVKVGGVPSTGGNGLFKYTPPTLSTIFPNNGRIGMILVDGPSNISGYKLNVNDSINSAMLSVTADSVSPTIYFLVPNTIAGGLLNLELIQPFGFSTIVTSKSVFSPTITSITPLAFDLTPTNVTVTGKYFGTTASVTMGSHIYTGLTVQDDGTNCHVIFTTRSVYESSNTITVKVSTGVDMIYLDNQGNQQPITFTYNPPTITSTKQVNDSVEISTTNTGTDFTQISLTMGTSSPTNLVITGTNEKIVITLPHALPEGEIQFNLKAGISNVVTSTLLVTPVINSVTQAPHNGGSITISGIFLNNAHVSIVVDQNTTDIVCAPDSNGESIICPVEAGSGTINLVVTNYKNFASDPTIKTEATTSTTYTIPDTPTPTDTATPSPTPTETATPSPTPKPTSTPEETEAPSSATTLISPLSLIVIFISFVLLI
nr:glycoprotein,contact site A [Dictyostelium discoideum]